VNENRIIWSAFILSLLLHLVLAGVIWRIPLSMDSSLAQAAPEPDEMEIVVLLDEEQEKKLPTRFTLVPERLATEEAPEDPDFASLYNSRAADRVEGGDDSSPAAEKDWIVPQVEIREDNLDGAGGVSITNQPLPQAPEQSSQGPSGDQGEGENQAGDDQRDDGRWALPPKDPAAGEENSEKAEEKKEETPELQDWWGADSPTLMKEGEQGPAGDRGFDFNQTESGTQGAGVSYVGNFSLNTYEWVYGPWLQKFGNQLYRHWFPPYAYHRLGMIHGMTRVRLVIAKNGKLLSLDILDTEGHDSLHESSKAALEAFAPYSPLPDSFPEDHLVLTCELHYPALR
jgi:hypothetical protein